MKKVVITFMMCWVAMSSLFAQDSLKTEVKPLKNFLYFVPQYLFIDGTRLDYEHRRNTENAFVASLVMSTGALNDNSLLATGNNNDKWFGVSTEVLHKLYLSEVLPKRYENSNQIYLAHGPYYQYANVTYEGMDWQPINNLNVLQYKEGKQSVEINKIGYSAILGVQIIADNRLTFDLYTGLAFRHSFVKKSAPDDGKVYNDNWFTPAYSGNVLLLGCKIGVSF